MDYRSMVNPTYLTAKITLFMLASAGNEDAKRIIGALDTQDELTNNNRRVNKSPLSPEQLKALMAGASLGFPGSPVRVITAESVRAVPSACCVCGNRAEYPSVLSQEAAAMLEL